MLFDNCLNNPKIQYWQPNVHHLNQLIDIIVAKDDRKLFVGGLSWETGEAQLKEYFGKFG